MNFVTIPKIVTILVVTFQITHGWNKKIIRPFYEWKTEFNSSGEAQLIPWKGTYLRIVNTNFESSDPYFARKNFRTLHVKTMDPRYNRTIICKMPNYSENDRIWSSVSLGNGKIVVLYGQERTVAIINLSRCSNVTFNLPARPFELHAIIPRFDTFDVLSDNYRQCKDMCVFTYNDQGALIQEFRNKPKMDNIQVLKSSISDWSYYGINQLRKNCDGFLERSCTLEKLIILNSSYDVVEEYNLQQHIEFHSFEHNNLTVCYQRYNVKKREFIFECELMDSDFKLRARTSFQLVKKIGQGGAIVQNFLGGGAVVFYEDLNTYHNYGTILYRRIDESGKFNEKETLFIRHEAPFANAFHMYLFEENATEGVYCGMMLLADRLVGKCFRAL